MRWRRTVGLVCVLLGGCSVEYGMRVHRFESPEVNGAPRMGSVSFGVPTVHDLVVDEALSLSPLDPEVTRFNGTFQVFDVGATIGVSERWDATVKAGIPYVPFNVGAKYQILGAPRATAKPGNVSLSATLAPGLYAFSESVGDDSADGYIGNLDASLIGGYRFTDWLMAYGGPYATYHNAFDVEINADGQTFDRSGDGRQFGVHLGLRFEAKYFAAMAEVAWSDARWEGQHDDVLALGVTISFQW